MKIEAAPPYISLAHQVHFTWGAADNKSPLNELQFSYKLQGYSDKWSDWQNTTEVVFQNLPIGAYQFLLRGRDAAGNITTFPAVYPFLIGDKNDLRWRVIHWPVDVFGKETYYGRINSYTDSAGRRYLLDEDAKQHTTSLFLLSSTDKPLLLWENASGLLPSSAFAVEKGTCYMLGTHGMYTNERQYLIQYTIDSKGKINKYMIDWEKFHGGVYGNNLKKIDFRLGPKGYLYVVAVGSTKTWYGRVKNGDTEFLSELPMYGEILSFTVDSAGKPHFLFPKEYEFLPQNDEWKAEKLPGGAGEKGSLVVDGKGTVHVILYSVREGLYYYSRTAGSGWSDGHKLGVGLANISQDPFLLSDVLENATLTVDRDGNPIILCEGSDDYFLITKQEQEWHYEPVLGKEPKFLADWGFDPDGIPYMVFAGDTGVYLLDKGPSLTPRVLSSSKNQDLWPSWQNIILYDGHGDPVPWTKLITGPTLVLFWNMLNPEPSDSIKAKLVEMCEQDPFIPGLKLLNIGVAGEPTSIKVPSLGDAAGGLIGGFRYDLSYPLAQYQLLLDNARPDGLNPLHYFFSGPPYQLPGFQGIDRAYYFENPQAPLSDVRISNITLVKQWLTMAIPAVKENFKDLKVPSLLDLATYHSPCSCYTASSNAEVSLVLSEGRSCWNPSAEDETLTDIFYKVLYGAFPKFYATYKYLPPVVQATKKTVNHQHIIDLKNKLFSIQGYNGYLVQNFMKLNSVPKFIDANKQLSFISGVVFTLTPEDVAAAIDGEPFYALTISRPIYGTILTRPIAVFLFAPHNRYVWKENLALKLLQKFHAPVAVEGTVVSPNQAGLPRTIDWSAPFPGSLEQTPVLAGPIVTSVVGDPDAQHLLVKVDWAETSDKEFRDQVLPSLLQEGALHGGILYLHVNVYCESYKIKESSWLDALGKVGIQRIPGFMWDGVFLGMAKNQHEAVQMVLEDLKKASTQ